MTIASMDDLKKAIKSAKTRAQSLVSVYEECVTFAYEQARDHANSSPFMMIREAIPSLPAKPKGMTQKALDSWVQEFTCFAWIGAKTQAYKKARATNPRPLPEQGVKFWDWKPEGEEHETVFNAAEYVGRCIKKLQKEGYNVDQILNLVTNAVAGIKEDERAKSDPFGLNAAA